VQSEMIIGDMATHLDKKNEQDLCVLTNQVDEDPVTRALEGYLSFIPRVSHVSFVPDRQGWTDSQRLARIWTAHQQTIQTSCLIQESL
jgi:hypothetical protein